MGNELFDILYPESRRVSGAQLIAWAKDDLANGDSYLFELDEELTVDMAIAVLDDSGSVTVKAAA